MAKLPDGGSILSNLGLLPLFFVAAFFGLSYSLPKKEEPAKDGKATAARKAGDAKAGDAKGPGKAGMGGKADSCEGEGKVEGTLRSYLGLCGSKVSPPKLRRFLLVTLPNPEIRSLAHISDSFLDALRLSMHGAGYIPFSYGPLRWPRQKTAEESSQKVVDEPAPGVWLFSNAEVPSAGAVPSGELLMLVLIGEDPVSGIDRKQYREAWKQISPFCDRCELLILGPAFSGGARTLAAEISRKENQGAGVSIRAASGTASLSGLKEIFQGISWEQLTAVDSLATVLDHLKKDYDNPTYRVLSEAHTLYGVHAGASGREHVYLPRDLSALRDAYREHSPLYQRIFPSASNSASLLPVPLSVPGVAPDVPVYMGETMAKAQETSLMAFARGLKTEHIQFLIIQVTDRLDAIFLARFFAQEAPNVRTILIGSDVLFNTGASRGSLTGTLTFSPSPIGAAGGASLPYANDIAAGFARAASFLLRAPAPPEIPLLRHSVIGRGGEWPLDTAGTGEQAGIRVRPGPILAFLLTLLTVTFVPLARWGMSVFFPKESGKGSWFVRLLCRLAPYAFRPYIPATDPQVGPESPAAAGSIDKLADRTCDQTVKGREIKRFRWLACLAAIWLLLLGTAWYVLSLALQTPQQLVSLRLLALTNGVNPLIPGVCFLLSLYSFVWMRIRGRYIDNYSFHVLPSQKPLAGDETKATLDTPAIFETCRELVSTMQGGFSFWGLVACSGFVLVYLFAYDLQIVSVESPRMYFDVGWTVLAVSTYACALATLVYFLRVWIRLFRVLRKLEAHPIRNAFTRLPDRISWTTIWSAGGLRPTFVSLQLAADYLAVLQDKLAPLQAGTAVKSEAAGSAIGSSPATGGEGSIAGTLKSAQAVLKSAYSASFPDALSTSNPKPLTDALRDLQRDCGVLANGFQGDLADVWRLSRLEGWRGASLDYASAEQRDKFYALGALGKFRNDGVEKLWTPELKLKEEFLALLFSSYIRYVFMQLRNLAGSIAISVSMLLLAIHSYPFHPYQGLLNAATFLFITVALVFIAVFYQMDIDPLLSRLSDTQSGKLDAGFAKRLLQFGLFPTITYLVSQFPDLGDGLLRVAEVIPGLPK